MKKRRKITNKINYFDKTLIVLIESFLNKKEVEAMLWAKVIFSLLLSVNILNLFIFITLIFSEEYTISKYHILLLVFLSLIFVFIYSAYRKDYFIDNMKLRDEKHRNKSLFISISIYLGSFSVLGLQVYIKSLINS
jgi:hypothetical protein